MDNESNPNDKEKLKSLLETLRKNDENVPKELLQTKYKKPYRELKDSIKEVADRISGNRLREGIVIKTDEAGKVLVGQIQTILNQKRNAGAGKELGRALYKEYSLEKFLQIVEEIRTAIWNLWIPYWQEHCCLCAAPECFEENGPPPKIYNDLTKEFLVDQEQNIWEKKPEWESEQRMIITAGACHILAEGLKNKEEADGMQSSDTNR